MINKFSLEVTVQYFVGESAILPCSYTEDKKQVDKVFWRHNANKKVYEFSPGRISEEVKYDTRAESFPEEYERGNYSIKITKLEKTDEGAYSCFIIPAYHNENMHLIIKAEEKPSKTLIEENQRTQMGITGITIANLIIVILACCVLLFLRKKRLWIFKPP